MVIVVVYVPTGSPEAVAAADTVAGPVPLVGLTESHDAPDVASSRVFRRRRSRRRRSGRRVWAADGRCEGQARRAHHKNRSQRRCPIRGEGAVLVSLPGRPCRRQRLERRLRVRFRSTPAAAAAVAECKRAVRREECDPVGRAGTTGTPVIETSFQAPAVGALSIPWPRSAPGCPLVRVQAGDECGRLRRRVDIDAEIRDRFRSPPPSSGTPPPLPRGCCRPSARPPDLRSPPSPPPATRPRSSRTQRDRHHQGETTFAGSRRIAWSRIARL